jgi:DNA-binding transcriptional LysR family regulator
MVREIFDPRVKAIRMEDLITLITLARTKSFTLAASLLGLSQPAISYRIHRLEKILGISIIEKNRPIVQLTEEGIYLAEQAEKILSILTDIIKNNVNRNSAFLIRIASSELPAVHVLPQVVKKYKTEYPHAKIDIRVTRSLRCIEHLLKGEVDLAITGTKDHIGLIERIREYEIVKIFEDEIVAAVPENIELSSREYIETLKELITYPLILREKDSGLQKYVEELFISENINLAEANIVVVTESAYTALEMVGKGLGITLISKLHLLALRSMNLPIKAIPFKKPLKRTFYAIYHRSSEDKVSKLIELIKNESLKLNLS